MDILESRSVTVLNTIFSNNTC